MIISVRAQWNILVQRNNAWCELLKLNLQGAPWDYPAREIVWKEKGHITLPTLRMPHWQEIYASEQGVKGQRARRA